MQAEPPRDPEGPSLAQADYAPTTLAPQSGRADGIGTVGRRPEAVQTGEDQIETEVELAGEVVAGLAHVLGNGLGEVGIVVSGELAENLDRQLVDLVRAFEGQGLLLQREAEDEAVEQGEGVNGHRDGEASLPQGP